MTIKKMAAHKLGLGANKAFEFMHRKHLDYCSKDLVHNLIQEFGYIDDWVLDVGCGSGISSKMFESKCKYIVGVDVQNVFIKSIISPKLDVVQADGFRLPFKDESFGGAILLDVIEHVQNDRVFLLEVKRVLKKNAALILETPNKERLPNQLKRLIGKPVRYPYLLGKDHILGDCIHIREYSKRDLLGLLRVTGFKSVKIKGIWLGLRGKFQIGSSRFPKFLENFSQCWLVKATK